MQQHVFTIAKVCEEFGVTQAIICPGSRSAPLVFAFTQSKKITCHSIIDERSAGFIGLGMAQQLQKPVVLICTSGTACLNFFPAIAEAFYQRIPLLVLTADRPPELLNQQDGQMIMQKGVYGKHVNSSHELLCFEEGKVDFQLTERIVHHALKGTLSENGFGPVHINIPLREPLYNLISNPQIPSLTLSFHSEPKPRNSQLPKLDELIVAWKQCKKKMILVGQMPPSAELTQLLKEWSEKEDLVILADIVSNQHGIGALNQFDLLIQNNSLETLEPLQPELILSFGGPFVSKALKVWLKKVKPSYHFRIQPQETLIDTYHSVTHFVQSDLLTILKAFQKINFIEPNSQKQYWEQWNQLNQKVKMAQVEFHNKIHWCEPTAINFLLNHLPENSQVQLGNSSSIRWVSWNGAPEGDFQLFSNRGTSGIDGSLSTAIGSAKINSNKIITFITGDLSLFYDQNAFWQQHLPSNLKIIVINNEGGNIFNWIEGPSSHPNELSFFNTPNQLSINQLSIQFGLSHLYCNNLPGLHTALKTLFLPANKPVILELHFEKDRNLAAIKEYRNLVVQ